MDNSQELTSCPYCGGQMHACQDYSKKWLVHCMVCKHQVFMDEHGNEFETREDAVRFCNKRFSGV